MIVETGIFADGDERALLHCPVGAESPYEPTSVTFYNRKGLVDTLGSFGLRVDAAEYLSDEDRRRTDGAIVRGTFLCTKDRLTAGPAPACRLARRDARDVAEVVGSPRRPSSRG